MPANNRNLKAVNTFRGGRPKTKLTNAIDGTEREMLIVLRRKLAAQIDGPDIKPAAWAALVRQFRDVDEKIRSLDAQDADQQLEEGDDGDSSSATFDPSVI